MSFYETFSVPGRVENEDFEDLLPVATSGHQLGLGVEPRPATLTAEARVSTVQEVDKFAEGQNLGPACNNGLCGQI